jgi:hypothetical protein
LMPSFINLFDTLLPFTMMTTLNAEISCSVIAALLFSDCVTPGMSLQVY